MQLPTRNQKTIANQLRSGIGKDRGFLDWQDIPD
jgi:hypothetical protein